MGRFAPFRSFVAAGVALAGLVACGGSGGGVAGTPQVPAQSVAFAPAAGGAAHSLSLARAIRPAFTAPLLPPAGTIYVGGFISPQSQHETPAQLQAGINTFEATIGRHLAIDAHYYQWEDTFPLANEIDDANNGRIPLENWHCDAKDADIAAGLYDQLIAKRALAIAAYGHPIFIRYKWEMNLHQLNDHCRDTVHDFMRLGAWYYSPTEYVAAFQHIRAVFAANGATNAVWIWAPSSNGINPVPYYPGDSSVDWVAFDRYDQQQMPANQNFIETFSPANPKKPVWSYDTFVTFNKPIMISETGAVQTGTTQVNFLGQADSALQANYPNVLAMIYVDSKGGNGDFVFTQSGLPAFIQFASGTYESGMEQPAP